MRIKALQTDERRASVVADRQITLAPLAAERQAVRVRHEGAENQWMQVPSG